jgi:tetratricopeptide (TPR) repeat protein
MYCSLCAGAHAVEASPETQTQGISTLSSIERAHKDLDSANLQSARSGFTAAIAAFDVDNTANQAALVEALTGLTASLNGLHQYDAAIAPARRALAIIRSRNGLYAGEQRVVLELLIDAQSQLGLVEEASDDLKLLERVSAASQSADPIRHAVTLTSVGDWYCRLGEFFAGRDRHRRASEALAGMNVEAELLNAKLGMARCSLHELSAQGIRSSGGTFEEYRGPIVRSSSFNAGSSSYRFHVGRSLRNEGENAVEEAARLAIESSTLSARAKVDTLLFAGDWFQLKGFTNTARKYYSQAAQMLSSASNADDRFDTPVRVLYAIPPLALRAYRLAPPKRSERFLVVEFTVRADGSVQRPRVIERNVTKSMVDETLDALRSARYRPRVVDGEPVESPKVVLRQSFDDPRELSSSVTYSNAE